MSTLDGVFDKISSSISALITKNRQLGQNNNRLKEDIYRLHEERARLNNKIASLQERIKVLELSRGLSDVYGGSREATKRVNKILREIDKCIALVNYK